MNDIVPAPDPELITRVRAIDGVADVYSPRSTLARVGGAVLAAAAGSEELGAEIAVGTSDGMTTVAARIATSSLDETPSTARRVADVLRDSTPPDSAIVIQVARIH